MKFKAEDLFQPPSAAAMCESMRSLGYTPQTAVADLVDNSVAAGARNIWISIASTRTAPQGRVAILDDGCGMTPGQLLDAMRPGSRNPRDIRRPGDLGRFGLGLKTASFSQCRCLTVATRSSLGEISILHWDLDHVARTNRWELLADAADDVTVDLGLLERIKGSGTLVLLSKIDAFSISDDDVVRRIHDHLGLTFHRFLERKDLRLFTSMTHDLSTVNEIAPSDPFLRRNKATRVDPPERLEGGCSAQVYLLPHRDRCSEQEWEAGALGTDWRDRQGCYVYRNLRLLVAGGWFNLRRRWKKDAETQLARVQIDFDNTWDGKWQIDVLKSRANPPGNIRARLALLCARARLDSTKVFLHRGRRTSDVRSKRTEGYDHIPCWRSAEGGGRRTFLINENHPVIKSLTQQTPSASAALRLIERTIPAVDIWHDFNSHIASGAEVSTVAPDLESLRVELTHFVDYEITSGGRSLDEVRDEVVRMEPYNQLPGLVSRVFDEILRQG